MVKRRSNGLVDMTGPRTLHPEMAQDDFPNVLRFQVPTQIVKRALAGLGSVVARFGSCLLNAVFLARRLKL